MDITKFMINDILLGEEYYEDDNTGEEVSIWHPIMITDLSQNRQLYDDNNDDCYFLANWLDGCDAEQINDIKPMPLEIEHLYKIGFTAFNFDTCFELRTSRDMAKNFALEMDAEGWHVRGLEIMKIQAVHQLQHALRDCSLDKYANNPKCFYNANQERK